MEKFLTKPKDAHTAVKTTARDHLRSYPKAKGTLHEDDGLLFCSTCNVVLDHTSKSSTDKHLESATRVQMIFPHRDVPKTIHPGQYERHNKREDFSLTLYGV